MLCTLFIWGWGRERSRNVEWDRHQLPPAGGRCCDAARAGGQMLRCGKDIGQMFSELISLCMQLIAFSVLTITPTSYLVLVQGPNNLVLSIKERTHGKAIKHNR